MHITFKTSSSAFYDDAAAPEEADTHLAVKREECSRILETIAERIRTGDTHGRVFDRNGNSIGVWKV